MNTLRDNVIPKATKGQGMTADVGGSTAGYIDLAKQIGDKLPLVIGLVLALSFVLLSLAFRSLLVPLKAVVMNLLSIAAAFGIVTFVFGHHWSATLVGLDGEVPIVSFVPLMMFAILFGLSMDYEVFLMTHVRERFHVDGRPARGGDRGPGRDRPRHHVGGADHGQRVLRVHPQRRPEHQAVRPGHGRRRRGRRDDRALPARARPSCRCSAASAWWMPRWLDRAMPHLSIEGEEYFAAQDAAAAEAAREADRRAPAEV